MSPLLLFTLPMVAYTAFLAVIHANKDTSTFASNSTTFSHAMVWLERAMHVLAGAVLLCLSLYDLGLAEATLVTVAMGPLFSLIFRPVLNEFRSKPWWYMGPDLFYRTKKDSALDRVAHVVAWWVTGRRYIGGLVHTYPRWLPFVVATTVETTVAVGLMMLAA